MNKDGDLTYSEAIEQVMLQNGCFAPLKLLYKEIWTFKDKSKIIGKTPDYTIQERVQRDPRFSRIANGVYALTDFLEDVEKKDLGHFSFENNEIIFKRNIASKQTERFVKQKVRVGQEKFRNGLIEEMKKCPITGIDDTRMLIASHIKPWSHSDDVEKLDVKNGLLLTPLFDKLFDKNIGLITFTNEKRIIISNRISRENAGKLYISNNQKIDNLEIVGREAFLEYHQKFIFQG